MDVHAEGESWLGVDLWASGWFFLLPLTKQDGMSNTIFLFFDTDTLIGTNRASRVSSIIDFINHPSSKQGTISVTKVEKEDGYRYVSVLITRQTYPSGASRISIFISRPLVMRQGTLIE